MFGAEIFYFTFSNLKSIIIELFAITALAGNSNSPVSWTTPEVKNLHNQFFFYKGIDIPATMDANELRTSLLQQLEIAQSYGFMKSEKLPNFLLVS